MSSTEESRTLEQKVLHYLQRYGVAPGSAVLVALSGGPDSLCLLDVLHGLRDQHSLNLSAAYLDHGIRSRSETDGELKFVQSACSQLGLELIWDRLPAGALQLRVEDTGGSLEQEARRARYDFLREAAARQDCDWIAVGHNADDRVETVVMRFFQGVDISGLPGMPCGDGNLIRPLIECTRAEILEYLNKRRLTYLTDSTNRDPRYLRNAVRLELLPAAERIFPGLRGSVRSLSEKLARLRDYVQEESRRRLAWKSIKGGYSISGEVFLAVPGLLRLFSIIDLLNTLSFAHRRIPHRFLSRVEKDDFVTGRRVVLSGYGIRLFWSGDQLTLTTDVVGPNEKGYFIGSREAGKVRVPEAGLLFDFDSPARDSGGCLFRSTRTGDRITLQGGSKTVRALFTEWRVMKSECWKIPIVEQRGGIVAVLGSLFGYKDRYSTGLDSKQGKALKSMVRKYDVEVE